MNKWDKRFINLAETISTWSKDDSKQVGAVIVDTDRRIISTGYNGLPKNINENSLNKDEKLSKTLHAEMNAILFSRRDLTGTSIYISTLPVCSLCAAVIIQLKISRVVCKIPDNPKSKWYKSHKLAKQMLKEAKVTLEYYQIHNKKIQKIKKTKNIKCKDKENTKCK